MPQVGVHAIVQNELGHVLLVKRNYLSFDWNVPGGMLEDGESIPAAVVREVLEETGYLVEVGELVVVGSRASTNDVIIVVAAKIIEKQPVKIDQNEIADMGFFPFNKLPDQINPQVNKLFSLFQNNQRGQLLVI